MFPIAKVIRVPYHGRTRGCFPPGDEDAIDGRHERRTARTLRHVSRVRRGRHAARPQPLHAGEGGAMHATTGLALVLTMVAGLLAGCATAPASRPERETLLTESVTALQRMRAASRSRRAS